MADHDQQLEIAEESSDSEEMSEEERLVSELTKMGGASRVRTVAVPSSALGLVLLV